MSYRDDQAAALTRAEALERDLAERERALGRRDEEIERLQAEVDALRKSGNSGPTDRGTPEINSMRLPVSVSQAPKPSWWRQLNSHNDFAGSALGYVLAGFMVLLTTLFLIAFVFC